MPRSLRRILAYPKWAQTRNEVFSKIETYRRGMPRLLPVNLAIVKMGKNCDEGFLED
jgi:hypothetical protein